MVAASAVAKAPNWLTSPCASLSFFTDRRMPVSSFRCGMRSRMVRNTWVPSSRMIMGQPHRKLLSSEKKPLMVSIVSRQFLLFGAKVRNYLHFCVGRSYFFH